MALQDQADHLSHSRTRPARKRPPNTTPRVFGPTVITFNPQSACDWNLARMSAIPQGGQISTGDAVTSGPRPDGHEKGFTALKSSTAETIKNRGGFSRKPRRSGC